MTIKIELDALEDDSNITMVDAKGRPVVCDFVHILRALASDIRLQRPDGSPTPIRLQWGERAIGIAKITGEEEDI